MFGVRINYERAARTCSLFFKLTTAIALILLTSSFYGYTWLRQNHTRAGVLAYFLGYILGFGVASASLKQYAVLLLSMRSRFNYINSLMKKRFLSNATGKCISNIPSAEKAASIHFVKSMGRLHDMLGQNMENINHCYSVPVLKFRF